MDSVNHGRPSWLDLRRQDVDTDEPLTLFDTDAMDLGAKPKPDRSGTADMFADEP